MPFTTEDEVRLRFQLTDTAAVPSSLVQACIDEAHDHILRFLDPRHDTPSPPGPLCLGELCLAGAALLRVVATKEAIDQKRLTVGSQRIEDTPRFQSLMAAATTAVEQAWMHLEPFLMERPVTAPADTTDTVPVLGEG